jgi:hypothetical protein
MKMAGAMRSDEISPRIRLIGPLGVTDLGSSVGPTVQSCGAVMTSGVTRHLAGVRPVPIWMKIVRNIDHV